MALKFKLTPAVKRFAVEKCGLPVTATDAQVIEACAKAVAEGKISEKKLASLCGTSESETANLLKSVVTAVKQAVASVVPKKDGKGKKEGEVKKKKEPAPSKAAPDDAALKAAVDARLKEMGVINGDGTTPTQMLGKASSYLNANSVTVKSAIERYDATRKAAVCPDRTHMGSRHSKAGQPATIAGRQLYHPSERDKAVAGSFFKWALACGSDQRDIPRPLQMTDHDRDIVNWSLRNAEWTGLIRGDGDTPGSIKIDRRKLNDMEMKALLDDATSGGLEAAPIVFDDAVILTPILHGELFPDVNVVNITRGRRIEGFSIGNPTFTSGTAEGTAITPFNTASFIQAFDTTIYNAVAAMEIGLDFEEDAPNDIGGIVVERYGLQAMAWLDEQIAVGDGTTEPEGIFVASGTTAVNSDNGLSGPPTVSDYEGLMFGVAKQFRKEPGARVVFVGNETSYRRARAIPVGPSDERRVFGMTHGDYRLLDADYRIQNSIANNQVGYVNLKRYRMYRRLGLNVRIETAGNYLATRNLKLIVLRMRFGGRLELGGAAAVMTDAQS